jgi:PAS domain S-box-containing protein
MKLVQKIEKAEYLDPTDLEQLGLSTKHFKDSESHYLREENALFPYLKKHGITQPPTIMWTEHDRIRDIEKGLYKLVNAHKEMAFEDFIKQLRQLSTSMADVMAGHYYKENNVLFPTSLKVIEESEWTDIRSQFDRLRYCPFTPEPARSVFGQAAVSRARPEIMTSFETGSLSNEEIEAIFDTLPVEVTFIDKDDKLRYFSQSKEMIFVRTKAAIGLKVQQCHPQKSLHVVNKILDDFRSGSRDVAAFWINFKGKLVYIRYFPVRNKKGEYLGCMEVTQDVTGIKRLEGEKRLLDTT